MPSGDGSRTGNRARPVLFFIPNDGDGDRARGRFPQPPVGGLVVARFRHHDSRHRMPLLHDHLVVSVKLLRADGTWGHLESRRLYAHVVAAGALYNQRVLEEVCDRLGLATEPRTPTPGLRPVIEIAGVPPELIDWTATRQRDTVALLARSSASSCTIR